MQASHTILPLLAGGGNYNAAIVLVADRPLPEIEASMELSMAWAYAALPVGAAMAMLAVLAWKSRTAVALALLPAAAEAHGA